MAVSGTIVTMTGPVILASAAVAVGVSAATAIAFGNAATPIIVTIALTA